MATQSHDPQVSACPICHRFGSQAHVLCKCPSTTAARTEGSMDHNLAVSRLPPGPMLWVGKSKCFSPPLISPPLWRCWSGQWDQDAIRALQPHIARCTRKQIKAVLGHIGRVTSTTASACWRLAPRSPTACITARLSTRSTRSPRSPWTTLADADHG